MHVGDVLHLWLHELVAPRHVGELEHVERHAAHARLRQRVQPGHVGAPVVDLRMYSSRYSFISAADILTVHKPKMDEYFDKRYLLKRYVW